jgi:hypothetical protein
MFVDGKEKRKRKGKRKEGKAREGKTLGSNQAHPRLTRYWFETKEDLRVSKVTQMRRGSPFRILRNLFS